MSNKSTKPCCDDKKKDLGFAGRLADSFIHSPLSPLLFTVMLLVGIYGLIATPRQEDPQISVPMIDIFLKQTGSSSDEMSELMVKPLERLLSEIPGVKHVYSVSDKERGIITLEFNVGENIESAIILTHNKVQANLDIMPPGADMPLIKPKEIDDVPVLTLTLWSNEVDDEQLRTLGFSLIQNLKQVPKTGNAFLTGGRSRQLKIDIQPEKLSGYGITVGHIAQVIKSFNTEQLVGSVEMNNQFYFVESGAFFNNARDFQRLIVGSHNQHPIYLSDVAKVYEAPEDTKHIVNYYSTEHSDDAENADGAPAVTIAIAKQHGANGVSVVNKMLAKVEELKGYLIPDNVHVEVTRNYGFTANEKVNSLMFKLVVATLAVTFLVWLSLGLRPAIVVLVTIPVVLVVTVFVAMLMGYTIDRVSLFALIFSIGFLVDNAIVIVENIYSRWLQHGATTTAVAVDAVREVGNPTILATYTVIAALLPMGFVRGMMGPYMEPIPALGSVAMVFSLVAALIFTPWLAIRLLPSMSKLHKMEARDQRIDNHLEKFFRKVIGTLVTSKLWGWGFLVALILCFFLTINMFINTAVTVKMLPFDNKSEFNVVVDLPDGTSLPNTASVTREIVEAIKTVPEVLALQDYVGTSAPFDFNGLVRHYYLRQYPWQAEIHVQLLHKKQRQRSSHEIATAVRQLIAPIAKQYAATTTIVEMPPGPPVLQTVVAEIHGPDQATRQQVARDLTAIFEQSELIDDVDNFMRGDLDIWRFNIDMNKAAYYGISTQTINQHLGMVMGQFKVGDVKQKRILEPTYILLQIPLETRTNLSALAEMPIMTQAGKTVPLGELGQFIKVKHDPMIFHKDLRPVEFVLGDAVGRLAAPIYAMIDIDKRLLDYTTPDGVVMQGTYTAPPETDMHSGFEWTGEWTVTYETFRDMGIAFGVALVAIYMLVVWQFGNFSIPAIIMTPIPLTLLGIIPGHWIMGADFTATSMIGWIALAGIIVRNSILLIDFTMVEVGRGMELYDAVITAVKARTRPIMITALALVLGSAVILTDPTFEGMAISLLFGVFVSTILTLLVIPLGCISLGEKTFRDAAAIDDRIEDEREQTQQESVNRDNNEAS